MENEEQHQRVLQHQCGGGGGEGNNNNNSMGDLRHLFSPIPLLPPKPLYPPPPPPTHYTLFSTASTGGGAFTPLHYPHQYEMMLTMGGGVNPTGDFHSDSTTTTTASAATAIPAAAATVGKSGSGGGFDAVAAAGSSGFGEGGTARWPRQETLTLLEVRSKLHLEFKEANHKALLWDQVSRIMSDEHGYQRSGKKCREKFENLYKYYKKTKDSKAGRHDGKHYRFFRQLEALFGETEPNPSLLNILSPNNNNNNNTSIHHQLHSAMPNSHCEGGSHSISLLDNSSSELHLSASVDNYLNGEGLMEEGGGRKRRGKQIWKSKIKSFIDLQMRKVMEKQEAWLDKMMRTLEHKEKERVFREEERRSHDSRRMEREHNLWTDERAWIEGRDRALMNALHKLTGKEMAVEEKDLLSTSDRSEELHMMTENNRVGDRWMESEKTELIRLKAILDARLEQCGGSLKEGSLWEEIATQITSLGYDHRTATMCKEKYWDLINAGHLKSKECHKKSKENWRNKSDDCSNRSHHQHLQTGESNCLYGYGGEINGPRGMGLVPPEISLGGGLNPMTDSFKFLLGNDGDSHLLASYGLELNKSN